MKNIDEIVKYAQDNRASDIHIVKNIPVRVRVDGSLTDVDDHIMSAEDCEEICRQIAGDELEKINKIGELDFAGTYGGIRTRVNLFRQQGSYSAVLRLLRDKIPELKSLGLPDVIKTFTEYPRGIVLVTGETGSGKSTTLASLLDSINHTEHSHIITLENPIEYVYKPDLCTINQREIGVDTESFSDGLRAALREDPDVILVGEMRDLDTIETALTAAETGHLVFATLHTSSAADSIDRMVDVFPEGRQHQIRLQLSMTLKAVVSQQLLKKREGHGRVCACEIMVVNGAIRNLIREGKTPQINNAIATSGMEGSVSMDNTLSQLYRSRVISAETALSAAADPEFLKRQLRI